MSFSTSDTIVAIATPPGRGGIGVVRISGPDAHAVALQLTSRDEAFAPRHATLATIRLKADPTQTDVGSGFSGSNGPTADHTPADVNSGFRRSSARVVDRVLVTHFPAPNSYTGDTVVEISAHGSPVVLKGIVEASIAAGARLAAAGEFTLRAFVNGRIDLPQAEAVADLVDAVTPRQAMAAFDQLNGTLTETIRDIHGRLFDLIAHLEASVDFPEEGYHFVDPRDLALAVEAIASETGRLLRDARRGRLIREGLAVAIVGPPNVGKSSLFNALIGSSRAIVTDIAGTTRDLITEIVDIHGFRVTLIDTAGVRDTCDVIESQGVARSRGAIAVADLVLYVADRSEPPAPTALSIDVRDDQRMLIVANKSDLPAAWSRSDAVDVSSMTGAGLDGLRDRMLAILDVDLAERPEITNVRHATLIEQAHEALRRAGSAALADGQSMPEEFVLADLQEARAALEEITGRRTPDDVLAHIFERFCIGK